MIDIRQASERDAEALWGVTQRAFTLYRDALGTDAPPALSALTETVGDVAADIRNALVYLAEENGELLGGIRVRALSPKLAYIYRFAVNPRDNNAGIGSRLLARAVDECAARGFSAVALHTNAKYFRLARYYYGKRFYVRATDTSRGYIRALFVKELRAEDPDLSPAMSL
jgi:predicted N-acetyltransferase YhbS